MAQELSARVKVTLKKYVEGGDGPVEVIEIQEQIVPLSSLPQEVQDQLMEAQNGGND